MKNFQISENQANSVLNYLATRPYAEVFQLVAVIQTLQEIKEAETKDENTEA